MKILVGPNHIGLENEIPGLQEKFPQLQFEKCSDREKLAGEIVDAVISQTLARFGADKELTRLAFNFEAEKSKFLGK